VQSSFYERGKPFGVLRFYCQQRLFTETIPCDMIRRFSIIGIFQEISNLKSQSTPYVLLLGTLFGTTLVVSRFSVGQFMPTTYIGLRLVLSAAGFGIVYLLRIGKRTWPRGGQLWKHATILGVLGTAIPMTGIVASLQYLSSGLASILITINPAITVILAHLLLADERLTRRKIMGALLALSGAVMLAVLGETGLADTHGSLIGYVLVLGAMIAASAMTVYTRKYVQEFDTIDVSSIRMFVAALVVMPLSYIFVGFDLSQVNAQGLLALIYAAIFGTFLGMLLSLYNIQRFGATAAVMTSYVIPVVASLSGVLFLGEEITVGMLSGMILISAGVWLLNKA
jgi:drug/metabolite transporter (DMT)-like permease